MGYDFIDQNIVSSCLIQAHTDDSFYEPIVNSHTGFAFDGNYYSLGIIDGTRGKASWYKEFGTNSFRGNQAAFPSYGLVLLSPVSMVILNQGVAVANANDLPLWMLFILSDYNALANNFNFALSGFLPQSVCYADGIVSVTYSPDAGNRQDFQYTITATSITNNVLTITVANDLSVGDYGIITGTQESFLNNQSVGPFTATSGASITVPFTAANYTNLADTGFLQFIALPPFPAPYPSIATQSHMVVSVDFAKDSVYLDVAA